MSEPIVDAVQPPRFEADDTATPRFLETVTYQRARLVVRCACDFLGLAEVPTGSDLKVDVSVLEFQELLEQRYGASHPSLVYRTDSTIERARLMRRPEWGLPKVVLKQGAPVRRDSADTRSVVRKPGPEACRAMPASWSFATRR